MSDEAIDVGQRCDHCGRPLDTIDTDGHQPTCRDCRGEEQRDADESRYWDEYLRPSNYFHLRHPALKSLSEVESEREEGLR